MNISSNNQDKPTSNTLFPCFLEFAETRPVCFLTLILFMLGLQLGFLSMFLFGIAVLLLVDYKKIITTTSVLFFLFLVFFLSTRCFHGEVGFSQMVETFFYYFFAYQLGASCLIFNTEHAVSDRKIFYLIYAFFLGAWVYVVLNFVFFDKYGLDPGLLHVAWPHKQLIPTTQVSFLLSPLLALVPMTLYHYKDVFIKRKISFPELILFLVVIGTACLLVVEMERRGPVVVFLVVFILFMAKIIRDTAKLNNGINLTEILFLLLIAGLVLYIFANIPTFDRFINQGIEDSPRFKLWHAGSLSLFEYPFGGCKDCLITVYNQSYMHAHNMWLDVGIEGGIISLVLLLLFQVSHLKYVRIIYNSSAFSGLLKNSIIVLVLVLIMKCIYEPVFNYNYTYNLYIFLFLGLLKNLADSILEKSKDVAV